MVPMGGRYADTGAPRGLGVDDEYCAPAYCCEDTREQTSYEAMKPLGYEEERGAPGHLCDESLSRKMNRMVGRGETESKSKCQHDR